MNSASMVRFTIAVIILLIFSFLILLPHFANAAVCYDTPAAVRRVNHAAWPKWTAHMKGHDGQRCWYPTGKIETVVARVSVQRPPIRSVDTEPQGAMSYAPDPPAIAHPVPPQLPFGYFYDVFQLLLSPRNRVNQSFFDLGYGQSHE